MSSFSPDIELADVALMGVAKEEPGEPLGLFFWICVGWVGLNIFGAIFANVLPLQNPLYGNYNLVNAAPEPASSLRHR